MRLPVLALLVLLALPATASARRPSPTAARVARATTRSARELVRVEPRVRRAAAIPDFEHGRCAALRHVPERASDAIDDAFTVGYAHRTLRPMLPALRRYVRSLARIPTRDRALRRGIAGWFQLTFVLGRFPAPTGRLCTLATRWARAGWRGRARAITPARQERLHALQELTGRAARDIDAGAHRLRQTGLTLPAARTFTADGLLSSAAPSVVGEALGIGWRLTGCPTYVDPDEPRFLDERPPADLLGALAVLRRPPTRADDELRRGPDLDDGVFRGYVRVQRKIRGRIYFVYALRPESSELYRPSCLRRLAPGQRREGTEVNRAGRQGAGRPGLQFGDGGPDGGGANCCISTLADLRNYSAFTIENDLPPYTLQALVRDGVASITAVFASGRRSTASVHDNLLVIRIPTTGSPFPKTIIERDASGRVLRRVRPRAGY